MKAYIIICLIILTGTTCMAQTIPDPTAYEARENLRELGSISGTGHVRTFDNRYEGTKGTPYVFDEWLPGEIFMKSKKRVIIKDMNYNCFENEVAYLDPSSKSVMLINKYNIDLFYLISGADTLVFVPVQMDENKAPVFAQLLYRGESSLYKRYEKEFIRANYEGAYSADRKYDEFADKSSLYFTTQEDSGLNKVKKSKKQFLALFPGAEDELSAFIKTEKLDLKLEEDIISLLKYYDSL